MNKEEINEFLDTYNKVLERAKDISTIYGNYCDKKIAGIIFNEKEFIVIYNYYGETEVDKFPTEYLYLSEIEIDKDIEVKNKHIQYAKQLEEEGKLRQKKWFELNELRRLSKLYKDELQLILDE